MHRFHAICVAVVYLLLSLGTIEAWESRDLGIPARPGEVKVKIEKKVSKIGHGIPPEKKQESPSTPDPIISIFQGISMRDLFYQCGKILNKNEFVEAAKLMSNNINGVISHKENCILSWENPFNDFCNVFCSLFGTKQSGQELEVYHHLVQMILNTRMEKEKLNLPYRRDTVAVGNSRWKIENYKIFFFRFFLSLGSLLSTIWCPRAL